MARLSLEIKTRVPDWIVDYMRLVVELGMDTNMATDFIAAHIETSFDGEEWMPLWYFNA